MKMKFNSEIIAKLVKVILIIFSTIYLGIFIIENFSSWYTIVFNHDDVISYINNEELTYLFGCIACTLNLILIYSLYLYHQIDKKWLKWINIIILIISLISIAISLAVEASVSYVDYDERYMSLYFAITTSYYFPLIPAVLIAIYDKVKLNKTKKN